MHTTERRGGIGTIVYQLDGASHNIALSCINNISKMITHGILKAQSSENVMTVSGSGWWRDVCAGAHTSTHSPKRNFDSTETRVTDLSWQRGAAFFLSLLFLFTYQEKIKDTKPHLWNCDM